MSLCSDKICCKLKTKLEDVREKNFFVHLFRLGYMYNLRDNKCILLWVVIGDLVKIEPRQCGAHVVRFFSLKQLKTSIIPPFFSK